MSLDTPVQRGKSRWRMAALIVAGWTLVAMTWAPPTFLVQREPGTLFAAFVLVLGNFIPWMMATPFLFALGRRLPIAGRAALRNAAIHAALAIVLLPVLAGIGMLIAVATSPLVLPEAHAFTWSGVAYGSLVTALYAVPTYIAVVAAGQALVHFESYRTRERLLARAELRALQAQINPHFLFNTLNAISVIGYRDPALADRALTRLAELLRMSLAERANEVALKDEIAFVRGYLDIHALLMGERLQLSFNIEERAWNAAVPAMLLQPLAENAVVHGVAKRVNGGTVAVAAQAENGRLVVSVRNDAPDAGAANAAGAGIGLANVRERLAMLYGDAQSLELAHSNDGSVVATVTLPFRELEAV